MAETTMNVDRKRIQNRKYETYLLQTLLLDTETYFRPKNGNDRKQKICHFLVPKTKTNFSRSLMADSN